MEGSRGHETAQQRLERCLRESSLPKDEFVARWVPVEFFKDASPELRDEMAVVVSEFHPWGFRLMARVLADADTSDLLPAIEVPTLLIWGADDRRSPLSVAEQFHAAIRGLQLSVIQGAGHISNMEQPEAFAGSVRRFLLAL